MRYLLGPYWTIGGGGPGAHRWATRKSEEPQTTKRPRGSSAALFLSRRRYKRSGRTVSPEVPGGHSWPALASGRISKRNLEGNHSGRRILGIMARPSILTSWKEIAQYVG